MLPKTKPTKPAPQPVQWGMTVDQMKALQRGQYINWKYQRNHDGTLARYKVTSVLKWKTRPDEVEVRVQRGLREFMRFHEEDFEDIRLSQGLAERDE